MATLSPPISETLVRVNYSETDQMGVVYHAQYLVWCEIGRTELMRSLGVSYAELEHDGTMLAVSDASVRYHAAARYDDLVTTPEEVVVRIVPLAVDHRVGGADHLLAHVLGIAIALGLLVARAGTIGLTRTDAYALGVQGLLGGILGARLDRHRESLAAKNDGAL
jgi:hypothetical protein